MQFWNLTYYKIDFLGEQNNKFKNIILFTLIIFNEIPLD